MNKFICTTTINPPTEALKAFAAMKDWRLIIAGDLKTPHSEYTKFVIDSFDACYLPPTAQETMDKALSDAIGWNCIQRRNFAFLYAHKLGADIIATVDDDNVPLPGWGENLLLGREVDAHFWETDLPAFDPISVAGYPHLWHRGFPFPLINAQQGRGTKTLPLPRQGLKPVTADIQADFWNGDPDIDAVCRMIHAPHCEFHEDYFPIAANKMSPFNSQNTFLTAKVLPHYFMLPHVGRMDDIWPSFYVQALGFNVIYGKASVTQLRLPATAGSNPNAGGGGHISNMKAEYLGYEHNLDLVQRLPADPDALWEYVPGRAVRAFNLYRKHFL